MLQKHFLYLSIGLSLISYMQVAISAQSTKSTDSVDRFLKTDLTQEDYDKIARLKRDGKRGDILVLRSKLKAVQDYLSDLTGQKIKLNNQEPESMVAEIKRLCTKLGVNDQGIDWQELSLCLNQEPGTSVSHRSLCTKIDQILMKVCDILMDLTGGMGFGIPITQADLPITLSTNGQAYAVVEPLTHTGATPAITIAGDCITLDMREHCLDVTAMTAAAIQLTGTNATVQNGSITTDGSDSAINIASSASYATIEKMGMLASAGSADLVSSPGPEYATMTATSFAVAPGFSGSAIAFGPGTSTGTEISDVDISGSNVGPAPAIAIADSNVFRCVSVFCSWKSGVAVVTPAAIWVDASGNQPSATITDTYVQGGGDAAVQMGATNIYGVSLKGLVIDSSVITVFGNNDGIVIQGSFDGSIEDCLCISRRKGFVISSGSARYILKNNKAISCDTGFESSGGQITLKNNDTVNCLVGYSMISSDDYILDSNSANKGDASNPASSAFSLVGVNNAVLKNNIAVNYYNGFLMDVTSSRVTFESNTTNRCESGFDLSGTDIIVENNSVNNSLVAATGIGIFLTAVTNAIVRNNRVVDVGTAFNVDVGSSRIIIERNSAATCIGAAFLVNGSADVILDSNIVMENPAFAGTGFLLSGATNIVLRNNITSGNGVGFSIDVTSTGITVERNTAANCGTGFEDLGATAIVFANNIANNYGTDYIGVPNTFLLSGLTTETYWYNARP